MKRKLILTLAASMMILSACNSDGVQDIPEGNYDSENYTTGSYQLYLSESLAEEKAEEASETENAEAAESETEESENVQAEITVPDGAEYRFIDMTARWGNILASNGLICSKEVKETDDPDTFQTNLNFIDINENKIVGTASLPAGFGADSIYTGSGPVLVKAVSNNYDSETQTIISTVARVYDDFSVEIIENAAPEELCFEHYGHMLANSGLDIVCLDNGSEVIVPGSSRDDDEYGFYTQKQYYMFPIDENRFVYRTGGYESLPGFGIYDFETNTASYVPDSTDLIPIGGVHDGKIYSVKTAWDGFGSLLFTTDTDTLETSFFMNFPYELELNEYVQYFMPENGNYILALKEDRSEEWIFGVKDSFYIIDPDTADTEFVCELPENFYFTGKGYFIDENTFAANGDTNAGDKLLVLDIK